MDTRISYQSSFILATLLSVVLFCGMQMQRQWLASSQINTIIGGYLGSILFTLLLTAVGNMESIVFGPRFHTKLFPEVALCLLISLLSSGMIHRVCITTCFLFSLTGLYYMNKMSKQIYPAATAPLQQIKKKK